jgi:hypothetical protein
MHSRIYQISKTPIDKEDYIEESNYYDHWFTNSVADYVDDDTNRDDDIEWLKDCYEKKGLYFGQDDNGEYFIVEDKTKFFEANFEKFQKELKELSEKTLDDFMGGEGNMSLYRLKSSYDDEFGFYIDDDGEYHGVATFNRFMRCATVGTKYYIGATIDYHF